MPSDSQSDSATLIHSSFASAPLPIGSTLNNRYLIERELKRGGFGIVYIARDLQLHSRPVVIKVLLEASYHNEYVVQKFHQEVEALSRIDHPGVVGIIDSGELADAKPFIVMQYVDGLTLRSVIKPEGIALERCAEIIRQMGRALTAAHEKGIFHRDLKPENVMLQDLGHGDEQVKIIDFGIAKIKDSVVAPGTETNISAGTVSYMAPEQLSGRSISAATDVYALGEIAYELVTGRKPFNPDTGFQLLEMQRAGVRISPSDLRSSLPAAAEAAILRALAFDPSGRYAQAKDFGDELARAIGENHLTPNQHPPQPADPAPTQFATELTPLAQDPAVQTERTVVATFPIIEARTGNSERVIERRQSSALSKVGFLLGAILLLSGLIGGLYWYNKGQGTSSTFVGNKPGVERNLSYSLTVQKMRDGKPYQDEFDSSGLEIFENGWKFRMNISSPQAGYLYLLNEGPAADGRTTFNVLFPAQSSNSGSPYVSANERVQTGWMVFDNHQGTEKFWIVWSAEGVSQLEAVRDVVNDKDKGTIQAEGQAKAVSAFLAQHSSSTVQLETDKKTKQTTARVNSDILVNPIELEHH